METKSSKYTKNFKELYGESENFDETLGENIASYDKFKDILEDIAFEVLEDLLVEMGIDEIENDINEAGKTETALKNKAKKTGFPLGILRQVFNRGVAAWKNGHVPGTTPAQWGMARVNSFSTGGRTTEVSDGALYRQAKKARAERRKKKK